MAGIGQPRPSGGAAVHADRRERLSAQWLSLPGYLSGFEIALYQEWYQFKYAYGIDGAELPDLEESLYFEAPLAAVLLAGIGAVVLLLLKRRDRLLRDG